MTRRRPCPAAPGPPTGDAAQRRDSGVPGRARADLWHPQLGYQQVKDELGWADFQVRSDLAIRGPSGASQLCVQLLLGAWFAHPAPRDATPPAPQPSGGESNPGPDPPDPAMLAWALRPLRTPWITWQRRGSAWSKSSRHHRCKPWPSQLAQAARPARYRPT
jgi:hypothetical protein